MMYLEIKVITQTKAKINVKKMSYTKRAYGTLRGSLWVSSDKIYSILKFKMSVRKSHLGIKKYFNSSFIVLIKCVTFYTLIYSGVYFLNCNSGVVNMITID